MGWTVRASRPSGEKWLLNSPKFPYWAWGLRACCCMSNSVRIPVIKSWSLKLTTYLYLVPVKNEWSSIYTPPILTDEVDRKILHFALIGRIGVRNHYTFLLKDSWRGNPEASIKSVAPQRRLSVGDCLLDPEIRVLSRDVYGSYVRSDILVCYSTRSASLYHCSAFIPLAFGWAVN